MVVQRGQSVCIIGPNGSGKSTLLNAVFGIADILGGSIEVQGRDLKGATPRELLMEAKLGYVLQAGSVFLDMTVKENLLLGAFLLSSWEAARRVERIFDLHPQLSSRRALPAGVLSGGERRVLEIARALLLDPEILLLDEPSIGLEPRAMNAVFQLLTQLQRVDQKTIIIVEQNVEKALDVADVGYVFVGGQVALTGGSAQIRADKDVYSLFLGLETASGERRPMPLHKG
jgi:branched-chain amino acid transport system ATP-binding protein